MHRNLKNSFEMSLISNLVSYYITSEILINPISYSYRKFELLAECNTILNLEGVHSSCI